MVNHHNFPRTGGHPANPEERRGPDPIPEVAPNPAETRLLPTAPLSSPGQHKSSPAVDRGTPPARTRRRPRDAVVQGQPAPGGRVPWAALPAALAVRGSCGPWPSCPPGRPPCRPPPGTSRIPGRPVRPAREWPQRRAPVLGGDQDQGPCGFRPGDIVPPARRCHCPRRYAAGGPAGSGAMLPQSGPNRQQPAPPPGAGRAPAAGSAKAAVTTVAPGPPPDAHLVGDLPHQPQAMTGLERPPTVRAAAGGVLPVQAGGPGQAVQAGRADVMDLHAQHPVPGLHLQPSGPRAVPDRVGGQLICRQHHIPGAVLRHARLDRVRQHHRAQPGQPSRIEPVVKQPAARRVSAWPGRVSQRNLSIHQRSTGRRPPGHVPAAPFPVSPRSPPGRRITGGKPFPGYPVPVRPNGPDGVTRRRRTPPPVPPQNPQMRPAGTAVPDAAEPARRKPSPRGPAGPSRAHAPARCRTLAVQAPFPLPP